MTKPFHEEECRWFDIELYNAENVAEMGDHATTKKFTCPHQPPLDQVAAKAKELGFDCFIIKEVIEIERHYIVDECEVNAK